MSKNGDGHMMPYDIWSFQDCPDGEDEKGASMAKFSKISWRSSVKRIRCCRLRSDAGVRDTTGIHG